MKRGHRRWHRLLGSALLPLLVLALLSIGWARRPPTAPAALPAAIVNLPGAAH